MFDLLHKHKRVAQVILALITLPFAFFGVDYYFRGGRRDRRSRPSAATRSRRRNSTTRCASSRNGCASRSARTTTRRCSTTPRCATRCSTSSSISGCSKTRRARRPVPRQRHAVAAVHRATAAVPGRRQVLAGQVQAGAARRRTCRRGCSSSACAATDAVAAAGSDRHGSIVAAGIGVERYLSLLEQKREVARRDRSPPSRSRRTSRSTTPTSRRSTTSNPTAFQTPESREDRIPAAERRTRSRRRSRSTRRR